MSVQPPDWQDVAAEENEKGELTPSSLATIKRHLKKGKDLLAEEENRLKQARFQQKKRDAKKRQHITRENSREKVDALKTIERVATNESNLIADQAIVEDIKEYYPDVLQAKKIG